MSRFGALRLGFIAKFLIHTKFLVLFSVAVFPAWARAQSQENMIRANGQMFPACNRAALDLDVVFLSSNNEMTVAFNLRNTSQNSCVPQLDVSFPMFDPEQSQKIKPFDLCTDCEDRLPNGEYRAHDPLVLNSGDVAHQTYRWKTVAPNETVTCLPLRALFNPVLVVAPTLFKPVCSEIAISRIYPGEFVPSAPNDESHTDEAERDEVFVLSSRKPRYFQDEMFTLHAGLADTVAAPPSGKECPTLFLRERSPDGSTRFDEVRPNAFKTCETYTLGSDRNADWQSGIEVDSGMRTRWSGIGEHSFELFQLVGSPRDAKIQFVRSNKLTLQIDDPALIARNWQGKVNGVGVDVTLDKDTYKLGEDVPLHIAVENFDAPVPVYATSPVWDPYPAIGVEIRDVLGRPLPEDERFAMQTFWTGHGLGPMLFPRGKLVTIERTLVGQGWLPNRPGLYTVVVTWCTLDGTHFVAGSELPLAGNFRPYRTVQAKAPFRILSESSSASKP
jgi:hypothetical protein